MSVVTIFITVVTFGTCRKCSKDKLKQLNKQALRMVKVARLDFFRAIPPKFEP